MKYRDNFKNLDIPSFTEKASEENLYTWEKPTILQVNVGNICNIACKHCHVNAGPAGDKVITEEVKDTILKVLEKYSFEFLDMTGGAPEMMPGFKDFIKSAKDLVHVMVRTNLCILEEDEYKDLPEFFAENKIHLIASVPSTKEKIMDKQRGKGVYEKSIKALRRLNELGYGKGDLQLDLVFNPNGAMLPPAQEALETRFKAELLADYGIVFDNLLAITNNPIGRFADFLVRSEQFEEYMDTLYGAFNPSTVDAIMCKNTLSVAWDGKLYDCDFNQAIDLEVNGDVKTIFDVLEKGTPSRKIAIDYHCYGCTAGAGSSCGGSLD